MAKSEAQRQEQRNQNHREKSAKSSDIAPIPNVVDPARRDACRTSFKLFCETYYPEVFALEWSEDHLRVIAIIEDAVLRGGLAAIAMPRGSGKSSLCVCAAVWSLLYGHRRFAVIIGASEDAAADLLDGIKLDLEVNDLLMADFPSVCHPVRCLDGQVNRAKSQHVAGRRTRIGWTGKTVILPTVEGSKASGGALKACGITGRIRGMNITTVDGQKMRPDLVIVDDPQTDESAGSLPQITKRMKAITGSILGLAGPKKKIAGFAAVTVIEHNDVADQLLDRKKNPQWQGQRCKMLNTLPTDVKLWDQYAELRASGLRDGHGLKPATDFYVSNQSAMDVGAQASWQARFNADEHSAIQHAMNLKLSSEEAFAAEYQNEPVVIASSEEVRVPLARVVEKISDLKRGVVPKDTTALTAYCDVHGEVLYWIVVAWQTGFNGHVVDYGTWPDQGRNYWTMQTLAKLLSREAKKAAPTADFGGQLYHALSSLLTKIVDRDWITEDGKTMRVGRMLVDSGWDAGSGVVRQITGEAKWKKTVIAAKGKGLKETQKPFADYSPEKGWRQAWHWRHNVSENLLHIDTNAAKTFVAGRLSVAKGDAGRITVFNGTETEHKLFFEHLTAEVGSEKSEPRACTLWTCPRSRENHWFDCLVGATAAASEQGITTTGYLSSAKKKSGPKYRIAS